MRWLAPTLLLLICPFLRGQEPTPAPSAQPSTIEGIAIDAITRHPLASVHVTLRMMTAAADSWPQDDAVTYGAITRPDGHFSIAGLNPGLYVLRAQHNGYVYLPLKAPRGNDDATVALKPGDQIKDLIVNMTPHAVIVGHVLDENGDPVQYVEVTAEPADPKSPHAMAGSGWAQTDDRGQFRFALPPGKFYIQTAPGRGPAFGNAMYGQPEIHSDGLPPPVYGTVFYPAAASKDKAVPIEAGAGQEVDGVDIHLARTRSFSLSGTVTAVPEGKGFIASVALFSSAESPNQFHMSHESPTDPDGKFTVSGLSPGRYRLIGMLQTPDGANLRSPAVDVELESSNESAVTLPLVPGETVSGTLEIDDSKGSPAKKTSMEKLTVRLEPDSIQGDFGENRESEVGDDGTFRVEQVFPGKFHARVLPMPENAYIKSVRLGGTEAPDGLLDLSRGVSGANINVTLSRNGGRVEGKVVGEDGASPASPFAFVILTENADDLSDRDLKPVQAGEKFSYSGLRPGKYRLLAIDGQQLSGDFRSAVKALLPTAPEIEIHEGDRLTKDVKLTPAGNKATGNAATEIRGATR